MDALLFVFILLLILTNLKPLVLNMQVLRLTSRQVIFYHFVAYGTAVVYGLVSWLAADALSLLWNARFGVWGFMGEFSLLFNFFLIATPIAVGMLVLILVDYLVRKWSRNDLTPIR